MTIEAQDRLDENLAAIRAVAALLGAADGISDEVRAEACALIMRLAMASPMVGADGTGPETAPLRHF